MSNNRLVPPDDAVAAQRRAADPDISAWVAANAGSGKTYVLSRRVVRLMLAGTPPGSILCLTFTKAAAATMANRVFNMLADWVRLDDRALADRLAEIDGGTVDAARIVTARRLFARALETPGGLKVQTIHAFCERVLRQFPFEANVPSHFTVLDDPSRAALMARAKAGLLLAIGADAEGAEGRALRMLSARLGDSSLAELLDDAMAAMGTAIDETPERTQALKALLGMHEGDTIEALERETLESPHLPPSEWLSIAATLRHLSNAKTERLLADALEACHRSGASALDRYRAIFLTTESTIRDKIVTKAVRQAEPALAERMQCEAHRLLALHARAKAVQMWQGTDALMVLARALKRRVDTLKAERGALDFNDLIVKTTELFARVDAAWVLYKLDQGIDHVLVDEAQDTSPAQWAVVNALVSEFAAGSGARGTLKRSLFVVGDEKQSIYSFQGADPAAFDEMLKHFSRSFLGAERPFERITLDYSFRSTGEVLQAVDQVFAVDEARRGLSSDAVKPVHRVIRTDAGIVDVWPAMADEPAPEPQAWTAPLDAPNPGDAPTRLAGRIAATIAHWLETGRRLPGKKEAVRPGDILILVQRRSVMFEPVIRALKAKGVPVAGADRLVLGAHIAVIDLMALGDCLITPEDDLSLACVLKSPLIGIGEDDLFSLATGRTGSLWQAVAQVRPELHDRLERWRIEAAELSPAAFYAAVLARDGGRRAMLARFGNEAADPIDEFLALAISFGERDVPTLPGFLHAMRESETEVKRDMDLGRDEVRVMTVHGAKGLEADIVFLADTLSAPSGRQDPRLLALTLPGQPAGAPPALVWAQSGKNDVEVVGRARAAARIKREEEYRRLLYVAMTRAADHLIICGIAPKNESKTASWYALVAETLKAQAREMPADDGVGTIFRWTSGDSGTLPPTGVAPLITTHEPGWLREPAPRPNPPPRTLVPSRSDEEAPPVDGATRLSAQADKARRGAIERGLVIHRLLQSLPDIAVPEREAAADRLLARQSAFDDGDRAAVKQAVFGLLAQPEFRAVFGAEARAEVSLAGMVGQQPVSGQIDRLLVTSTEVLLVDFKTGAVPRRAEEAPQGHVAQMALYAALLEQIFPGRPVHARLIYTREGKAITLAPTQLEAALARVLAGAA